VLPLQAVLFNLLSVGAAYGLIVLVFVDGLGSLKLVGTRTWWLPRRLGWLPHLNPEGERHVHRPVLRPDDGRDDLDDGRDARRAQLAAGVVPAVAGRPAGDVTSA
jgi:hypothetical protein